MCRRPLRSVGAAGGAGERRTSRPDRPLLEDVVYAVRVPAAVAQLKGVLLVIVV